MKTHRQPQKHIIVLLTVIAVLLLGACQPVAQVSTAQPSQPIETFSAPPQPAATQPADQPAAEPTATLRHSKTTQQDPPTVALDINNPLARNITTETLEAVPASAGGPNWEVMPRTLRVTLEGYPVANHMHKPQIFVYPVGELANTNEAAGKIALDLQTLLQTQKTGYTLPFLPLFNAAQVIGCQVKFLDFKDGKGVRYLTQYDQGLLPINNYELFYTYQGLTNDGKYYVAVILPVTNPKLPANDKVTDAQMKEMNDFPAYLAKTVAMINDQPAWDFTPNLAALDELIQTMKVH